MIKNILLGDHKNILGINRRNINYVYPSENRKYFKIADEKALSKELFKKAGIPHPEVLHTVKDYRDILFLDRDFHKLDNAVIKPNKGRGGNGILVLNGVNGKTVTDIDGRTLGVHEIKRHCADIIMGVYSFGSHDIVIIEEKLIPHDFLKSIYSRGLADFRFILYKKRPVMAMLRLPTSRSHGKANLHQGGIGVGIDLAAGKTTHAMAKGQYIERHPDSGSNLGGLSIPFYREMLEGCIRVAEIVPLGYIGFDFTLDEKRGPMLLEINARPGLEIQKANKSGLLSVL